MVGCSKLSLAMMCVAALSIMIMAPSCRSCFSPPPPPPPSDVVPPPPSDVVPPPPRGDPPEAQDYLDYHNMARAAVGVGPMVWDSTVYAYAQDYANERKADCLLQHSTGGPYGENIFWGMGREFTATDAIAGWVSEKQWYDYASNSCDGGKVCGHYTQVVWSNSVNLGCARVQCDSGAYFITCNYNPPGNYVGQRPY